MLKKIFVGATLLASFAVPQFFAAAETFVDTEELIRQLQEKVNAILKQIEDLKRQPSRSAAFCHTFKADFGIGTTSNNDVSALHTILTTKEGFEIPRDEYMSSVYGESTASAVVDFQAKYGIRQTGFVGPITRTKLNQLYGCNPTPPTPPPTTPIVPVSKALFISALSTSSTVVGGTVYVYGKNFDDTTLVVWEGLSGFTIVPTRISPTSLSFIVPLGASLGIHLVQVGSGRVEGDVGSFTLSNAVPLKIVAGSVGGGGGSGGGPGLPVDQPTTPSLPIISSVGPTMIHNGDTVVVHGSNFDSNSIIYFDHDSNKVFDIIKPNIAGTTYLSFSLPANTSIGTHIVYVAQRGFGDPPPMSNEATFSVLPSNATVSCSFALLNNATVSVGQNSSWAVTSSPVGLKAYWYGAKNGVTDANGLYAGTTDFTQTYKYQSEHIGTYTRYLVLKDASGNVVCTTNTINMTVNAATTQVLGQSLANVFESIRTQIGSISRALESLNKSR